MMKSISILLILFSLVPVTAFLQNSRLSNAAFNNKPVLIRGPYLQVATNTSIVIRWRTDALTRSRVRYGTTPANLNKTADDVQLVTEHQVKLTGLMPQTKYYYAIGTLQDTLQFGNNNYFVTLPVTGKEDLFRVALFGDCGYLSINQANVRDEVIKYLGNNYLNGWLLLGDNAYNDGTDIEYQSKFFNIYKDALKKYPLYPCPGNHDYHDLDFTAEYAQNNHTTVYYQNFSTPVNGEAGGVASHNPAYYSFDIGNIHFLSLDSYGKEQKQYFLYDTLGPQVQWLKRDLEANTNKGWVIVYTHFPPYSMTTHNSDTESGLYKIRENLLPILERYKVDLMICGHSHGYERTKLMNGYYGKEADFNVKYNVSNSTGLYNGSINSAPYVKDSVLNKGIVYVVAGSSSYVGKPDSNYPHAAMVYSNATEAGAGMLEVQANRLDFKWICADSVIRDHFTMMKNVNKKTKLYLKQNETATLTASFITDDYKWSNNTQTGRSIVVTPPIGKSTYTVHDKFNNLKDVFEVVVTK
jgi:acid phosphatase type 7